MRKFNARLPVILALSMCAGIFIALILFLYGLSAGWLAISFLPAALIFLIRALVSKKILKSATLVLLPLLFFYVGALCCGSRVFGYDRAEIEPDTYYYIHGVVAEKGSTANGEYAILKDVTVDGRKIDGRMNLYLSPDYGEICDIGYTVELFGSPEILETFTYGKLNYRAEDNIKYTLNVYGGLQSTYRFSLLNAIRISLRDVLFENLSYETAAVSLAMLTGNTRFVSEQSIETFRYGGIAHIFAVSGLHVGIIYSLVSFFCKKLKLNKYLSAAVCISFIFFYIALCGYTVSSVRAAIMCLVATLAKLIFRKNDGLNSLSVAVLIILTYSPLSLFFVGFQLSVCATGGIFALSKLYAKALNKIKIPKKLSSAAGLSLGAQTATAPILLADFGYLSGAGILLNIVFVPLLSAVFALIFVAVFLCLIIQPLAPFVLPYALLPLELFLSIITGLGFEKTLISGFGAGMFIPLYFIGALFLSDKINFKTITRLIALGCSAIILASYVLARYSVPNAGYKAIITAYGSGGGVIIKSRYGTLLIITDDVYVPRLENALNENYINNIDAIVILGDNAAETYARLDTDCNQIRLNDRFPDIQPYGDFLLMYESNFNVCGVECKFFDNGTLYVTFGGISMGICSEDNFALPDCDIIVTDTKNAFVNCATEIYFNKAFGELNAAERGDITVYTENGDFSVKTVLPPR